MNPSGPELRDIHLPADPSWWPPAPGWWIVAAIVLGLTTWAALALRRRADKRRWQKQIIGEFERIAADPTFKARGPLLISEVSQLLRRASRLVDPAAPSLRGKAWLGFLDSILGSDEFSNGPGRALLEGPYQRDASIDVDALLNLARRWIKRVVETRVAHV